MLNTPAILRLAMCTILELRVIVGASVEYITRVHAQFNINT